MIRRKAVKYEASSVKCNRIRFFASKSVQPPKINVKTLFKYTLLEGYNRIYELINPLRFVRIIRYFRLRLRKNNIKHSYI